MRYILKILLLSSTVFFAQPLLSNETIQTFDPYDGSGMEDKISDESRIFPPTRHIDITSGLIYTSRSGFEDKEMNESSYYSYISLAYKFTERISAGITVPYMFVRFEDHYRVVYENGPADIQTYASYNLPRSLPLFCTTTFTVQWPTGNYDRYLGTGEFSFGFSLGIYKYFSIVYAGINGSYFINNNPPDVDIPDTKMVGFTAGMNFNNNLSSDLTFDLYNTSLINRKEVIARQIKGSLVYSWNDLFSTSLTFTYEFYPTTAYIPGFALSFNF